MAGAGSGVNSKAVPPNAMLEDASWFGDMWNPALSLMFHMYYSAFCQNVWLHASACIGTMYVHARIEGLHVYARIPSFACFCLLRLVLRAEQLSACCWPISGHGCASALVGLRLELSVCLHVARELSICWRISRAERVSAFSSLCLKLSEYLHVLRFFFLHVPCLLAGFES